MTELLSALSLHVLSWLLEPQLEVGTVAVAPKHSCSRLCSCLMRPAGCTEAPTPPAGGTYDNCVLPAGEPFPCAATCTDPSYTAKATCNGTTGLWQYAKNNTCGPREGELAQHTRLGVLEHTTKASIAMTTHTQHTQGLCVLLCKIQFQRIAPGVGCLA
jgi:hypothetical protein